MHFNVSRAGPREPDLGYEGIEVDDSELGASYMDVSRPQHPIDVVPASPNSSWLNIVFNEREGARNRRSPSTEFSRVGSGRSLSTDCGAGVGEFAVQSE